jgi:uncharacterized protein
MIDVHLHVVAPNLPGAGSLSPLLEMPPSDLAGFLRREMRQAGITHAIAVGRSPSADDPTGIRTTLRIAQEVPGLHAVVVADPERTEPEHLRPIETAIASRQVLGLKLYLGYTSHAPDHPGFRVYYQLAERYQLPVFLHTGGTHSPRARLRLAHPLLADDLAVDHPNVRFILSHFGNPWLLDAAAVIRKNVNVWADLSGLAVGLDEAMPSVERKELLHDQATALRRAFLFAERPNRFLFGSDWPIVPLCAYGDFIRSALPKSHHQPVFQDNAGSLFRI